MAERSFLARASWTLAIVAAAGSLSACGSRERDAQPSATPAGAPLGAERTPEPPAAPASERPASPSTSPTTDAAAAQRAEQEKAVRAQVAAAKAKADSLSAQANSECPDLKPGELRHPGSVGYCNRLRSEAANAVGEYESLKKQAQAAGITVQ
jgi:hypothetical protein